jgi:type III pantothenate kinase
MTTLLVDIGNTALKASWADGITLGKTFRYQGERMVEYIVSLTNDVRPELMVLSSARHFNSQQIHKLECACDRMLILDSAVLSEKYDIPSYLTPDRAASVIASRYLFKGRPCTIFDFGTTLTIDFLDSEGVFKGGCISPGCRTRFRAVNRYTGSLPLLDTPDEVDVIGNDIPSSIYSGVISGMMFEVDGYVSAYPENICVFTGGDAIYFAKRRKNSIFVVCNLVLMGLALIALEYDQKDK